MQRRTILKHLAVMGGMVLLLPSCVKKVSPASIALDRISVSADDEELIGDVCETLLPATTAPGGRQLGAHLFSLRMVNDCFDPSEQGRFIKGLSDFTNRCIDKMGKPFSDLTSEERKSFLLSKGSSAGNDEKFFYSSVKRLIAQAYTNSEYYMTKVNVYELVPGRYHGCVSLKLS